MVSSKERRISSRHECLFGATYRPAGDAESYWPAMLLDISAEGAGLIVSRAVPVGAQITVRWQPEGYHETIRRDLDVRHIQPFGASAWLIGGPFDTELAAAEFHLLS
jgi:hypothetical protein